MKRCALLAVSLSLLASCETIQVDPDDRTAPELFGRFGEPERLRPTYGDGSAVPRDFIIGRQIYIRLAGDGESIGLIVSAQDRQSGIASLQVTAHAMFNCPGLPGMPRKTVDFPSSYTAQTLSDPRVPPRHLLAIGFTVDMLRVRECGGGRIEGLSIRYDIQASNHAGVATGPRSNLVTVIAG